MDNVKDMEYELIVNEQYELCRFLSFVDYNMEEFDCDETCIAEGKRILLNRICDLSKELLIRLEEEETEVCVCSKCMEKCDDKTSCEMLKSYVEQVRKEM